MGMGGESSLRNRVPSFARIFADVCGRGHAFVLTGPRKSVKFAGMKLTLTLLLLAATPLTGRAQLLWTAGVDDNDWPLGTGGGPNASFVQEGGVNPLPGSPFSTSVAGGADDDYYFAGDYTIPIDSVVSFFGDYTPIGLVELDEEAVERAFAGSDNDKRFHFNLPTTLQPTDLLSVTFDSLNLHTEGQADPRYGVEVYVNGVLVQPEIIIRPAQLGVDYTSTQFSLASVNAVVGPGADNIVSLRGISYSGDGGGSWMGIDYVQLDKAVEVIPPAVFPWAVGLDDNAWPLGNGGGASTSFVQENEVTNPLPGSPASPEVDQQADNDYYLAGSYATVIPSNGDYTPVGTVLVNEEAAERALTAGNTELRYHCNLPNSLQPNSLIAVTFDASELDTGADPRYGIEVYFNGVLVQPEILIRPAQLGKDYTTPQFSLTSVNAVIGSGFDNIVTLRGINYSASGGGNRLGIDYVQLNPVTTPIPSPGLPWAAGLDDNAWPQGDGGGENATFVQESGTTNPLPGSPVSTEVSGGADNDYYFAGYYSSAIAGNGSYEPVGAVPVNEEAAERALTGGESELRYHFNLPAALTPGDSMSVAFDALDLDTGVADPRYGVEVYVNGVLVQPQIVIRPAQLGTDYATQSFTLASVNARVGPGFDNIVSLRGINYSGSGGGNRLGIDYVQLNPRPPVVFPWTVGLDDDAWPAGNGGGGNASFVQENGAVNALPGNPNSPEVDQQADNDYYFAGIYSGVIPGNGDYIPVGAVLVNEEAAERAFAGGDLDLRYHFNLPTALLPADLVSVTFDALNLHQDATTPDPRFGVEVYFNGVKVQDEILIRPADLNTVYTTPEFSLASVGAETGAGPDNIVSLRGISYNNDGGGNWMGIDSVQLKPAAAALPVLLPPTVSNGQVTLNWTGTGLLEWSPALLDPWTPIIPVPVPPYSEPVAPTGRRYYRLRKP